MGLTRIKAEQISDIDYKQAVRVVTTTNVTLSGGAPTVVDGVTLQVNDRVLVNGQTSGAQNGLYRVQTAGTGSNGTWTRTTDANQDGEIEAGMVVMVTEGVVYADTQWKLTTNDPIVIGITVLTFVINILSSVGGANTQVQFNDSGTLSASSGFTFDKSSNLVTVSGNISAGNIAGTNSTFINITGTLITAAQPNITSVGTLSTLSVTGNANVGNIGGTRGVFTNIVGTLETASQPNITSVGSLSSLTVTGNISGANLNLSGDITDTSGPITIVTSSNGNITLSPNGTGVIVANKDLRNGQANGVGNIGSATGYFNTVFAKATSAQYADLAEFYLPDEEYEPGIVVIFGGENEITTTTISHDSRVAGIISTDPAFVMNTCSPGIPVALTGRVPCHVKGPITKGDLLVTSECSGVAQKLEPGLWQPGCVLGKSLESISDQSIALIEVVVGRF